MKKAAAWTMLLSAKTAYAHTTVDTAVPVSRMCSTRYRSVR